VIQLFTGATFQRFVSFYAQGIVAMDKLTRLVGKVEAFGE